MMPGMDGILAAASALPPVNVFDDYVEALAVNPADCEASWELTSGGTVNGGGPAYPWKNQGVGADYQVKATLISGALTSGVTGVWQSLGLNKSWSRERTAIGASTCVFDIIIRLAVAPFTELATARITLRAVVES